MIIATGDYKKPNWFSSYTARIFTRFRVYIRLRKNLPPQVLSSLHKRRYPEDSHTTPTLPTFTHKPRLSDKQIKRISTLRWKSGYAEDYGGLEPRSGQLLVLVRKTSLLRLIEILRLCILIEHESTVCVLTESTLLFVRGL